MYCSHFGLHRPPFNNTPDPTFYFSTPEHEEALATLQYATEERKGFVLVTGEIGAGKTLTARMFLRQIEQEAETAVIANTHLSGRQLLAAVCAEFDLNPPSDASNLELSQLLQEFLLEQFARNRYVVVVIDEAQNLSDEAFEELRMLGNLEADDAKLLQVCILGQPELRNRFAKPSMRQLDQRLFRRFHLKALTAQQTRQYIHHRLHVAGCEHKLFNDEAVDAIYLASKGIPRIINQISDAALLAAYADRREIVDLESITEVCEREVPRISLSEGANSLDASTEPLPAAQEVSHEQRRACSVKPAEVVEALGGLAESITECVRVVADSEIQSPPEEGELVQPDDHPSTEASEPVWGVADIAERCQRARDELKRLASSDYGPESNAPADTTDRSSGGVGGGRRAEDGAKTPPSRGRIAGFVNAVRQKYGRSPEQAGLAAGRTESANLPGPQPDAAFPTSASRRADLRASGDSTEQLRQHLKEREQLIDSLREYVAVGFNKTTEALQALRKSAASSDDLNEVKTQYQASIAEMERKLADHTVALKQVSDIIEERIKLASAGNLPEFQALSKKVIEQAQQLQDLRKRMLEQHGTVAQCLSDLRTQLASRAELQEVRAAQAETGRKIIERIERSRDEIQDLLDNIEERYVNLREQIEALLADKADAASLGELRSRQEEQFSELLGAMGRQRQETEQKLEQAVTGWKQTQKALDELAAQAVDRKELDEVRRQQAADAGRLLEMLSTHRRDVERLARELDVRSGDLLKRLNALPKGIATTQQLEAIRQAYAEQITDLTSRLAASEVSLEKARQQQERGLRAVAGKALDTARRVSILEEKGRPRRIRLELTPQVGIELGDMVATAQEQNESLRGDVEQARQTASELRQATAAIQDAVSKWQEDMDANWARAQSFFQDWQQEAVQAKAGADRMLENWRSGAGEIREEAERLRSSAKMAAEILVKMRQCYGTIESKFTSSEWNAELARAESLAERLERSVAAARTVSQQIAGRTELAKQELAACLADCKKQLADRMAQFTIEQKQMDQLIETRRQALVNIARSASSLAEVIDAGRRQDESRQPANPAALATRTPSIESREPQADTVEQINWPRFRTHQTQAQAG